MGNIWYPCFLRKRKLTNSLIYLFVELFNYLFINLLTDLPSFLFTYVSCSGKPSGNLFREAYLWYLGAPSWQPFPGTLSVVSWSPFPDPFRFILEPLMVEPFPWNPKGETINKNQQEQLGQIMICKNQLYFVLGTSHDSI